MVKVNNIKFKNFRNFNSSSFEFNKKSNIFFGNNGSGKTNILEGISLISKGRGIRNSSLINLINKDKKDFFINSSIEINNLNYDIEILSKQIDNKFKKIVKINDDETKESQDIINSSLSYLIFLPEMERLFQSSPSFRRNFVDRLIFSENNNYNKLINKYKKNINERTKILQNDHMDSDWIKLIESEISKLGLEIYQLRKSQLDNLNKNIIILNKLNEYYLKIYFKIEDSFFNESLNNEIYTKALLQSREFDKKFGGSKIGPHKSDIVANINNNFNASQLSTGQQKTVVLMMLLAQCYNLINFKKIKPVLLFDEICSHLDSNNRKILLDIINLFDIQIFLTGTDKTLFSFISTNVEFYNITEI